MKRNLIKALSLALCLTLILGACGGGSSSAPSGSEAASSPSSEQVSTASEESAPPESDAPESSSESGDTSFLVTDELLELTAHVHWGNIYVLGDDWTIEKEAARLTNVSLKGTASPMEGDSKQAFNLMIASKDIPDLVGGNRDDINQYGIEGAFVPLNDLIETQMPNFKAVLDANPDVRGAITAADGNIYQIPTIYENLISEAWFIRQDWLDKVGKDVPTTVDELYDVLTAFANEDPNGNGKKDEIGVFTRLSGPLDNKVLSVMSLYGVSDYWHLDKDGKVEIGLYTPEAKDAIKAVSKWYSEGLIDPEIFTRGGTSRDMLFPENNGAVIHDWIPSTSGYNPKMQEVVPGFKLVGFLPPVDSNGDRWEVASRDKLTGAGWAISVNNEHPEESARYMDFWWSEEGRRLSTYGIEGDTYTMVDGVPTYTDKVLTASTPINDYMRKIGGQVEDVAYFHDASYENFMMDEEGAKTIDLYDEADVVMSLNSKLPALSYTEEELATYTSKYPPCRTYMLEQLQKWVFDSSNIDAEYDNYMATLSSMGMDELVAIQQAAYDRLMGN